MLPASSQSCNDVISVWMGMLSSNGKCEIDQHVSSHIPTPAKIKMRALDKEIKNSIQDIIEKREKAMRNEDLFGILLESNQIEIQGNGNSKSVGMRIEEVISEWKLFYTAGQETTSSLLVWTLIMLSKYPEWQARAREVKPKCYTLLTFDCTLQKDMELGNLSLPAGVNVTMPILLHHQDGDIWGVAKASKCQVSFYPVGWDLRIFFGQNFTRLEAKIVLSLLLQNFSFVLSLVYVHAPIVKLSLNPKQEVPLILQKL
ncbi:hypothetical protein PHAVU_011G161400 [Phaseolus vulgaris]|uniref:Cytochrome P450 n=1 Tax=Phaseolus vulgaris TaxID=3885 RepID=V7AK50_PHAVU|nr:hypothetical protein PHAVU_011G161400g [Phaseolus vulgaris]ESW05213.1 hypothetical protein PHAVU_011G161400g [Phaseolus vulgaris]